MESIYQLLQGSYGYILIFQIIAVTGLFLFFLWMMAQRTKSAYSSSVNFPTADAGAAAGASMGITPSELQQLKEKCTKLEEEHSKMTALKEEYEGLQQKIKFLESKLLEYEILQEEIGTLSSLKVENEKLKSELQSLQRQFSASRSQQAENSAPAPTSPVPEMPKNLPEESAPIPMPDLSSIPNMDFSTAIPTPLKVDVDEMTKPLAPPPEPTTSAAVEASQIVEASSDLPPEPPPPAQEDGLEGLLKQIDSLTQNQNPPK